MTLIELSIILLTGAGAVIGAAVHDSFHVGVLLGCIIGAATGFVLSYAVIFVLIGIVMLINHNPLIRRHKMTDDAEPRR